MIPHELVNQIKEKVTLISIMDDMTGFCCEIEFSENSEL